MKIQYFLFIMLVTTSSMLLSCAHAEPKKLAPLNCTGMIIKTWGATWCPGCRQLERQIAEHQAETKETDPSRSCYPSEVRVVINDKVFVAQVVHIDTTKMSDEERMASGQLTHIIPEVQVWSPAVESKKEKSMRIACKGYTPTVEELQTLFIGAYEKSVKEGYRYTRECPR